MPRILLGLVLAGVGSGCAVQADRTRDLLELDLADRESAISRLEAEDRAEPTAWRAYSLGVLHAAADDFAAMEQWFTVCAGRTDFYEARMAGVRREHWRRWARTADKAYAAGRWADTERACAAALSAEAGHRDTELRAREARVMAGGPTAGDIVALVAADRGAVLDRWLESVEDPAAAYVRLVEQAPAGGSNRAAALTHFILAELAYAAGAPAGLADHARVAAPNLDSYRRGVLELHRRYAHDQALGRAVTAWSAGDDATARRELALADHVLSRDPAAVAAREHMVRLMAGGGTEDLVGVPAEWILTEADRLDAAGRHATAALTAGRVLAEGSGATVGQRYKARLHRAASLVAAGDPDGAAADLAVLLESPTTAGAYLEAELALALGDLLMTSSRWEAAARWYERAAADAEPTAALHLRRARAAFGAGQWGELQRHAAAAAVLTPGDPEAVRLLDQANLLVGSAEVAP